MNMVVVFNRIIGYLLIRTIFHEDSFGPQMCVQSYSVVMYIVWYCSEVLYYHVSIIVYHSTSKVVLYKVDRIRNGRMCFNLLVTLIYFEILFAIDFMCDTHLIYLLIVTHSN